jgi:dynein heavy chain
MKRENPKTPPTPENVMQFFIDRVKNNLHVILCFSPVGEKFRNRALKFPGLISGCTIDWYQPWPKDALVSVATHFLGENEFQCTNETKRQLFKTMAQVQESVSQACANYFLKFRRSAHVTPKSFLSFINSYKDVYMKKETDIGDMATRMNSGLQKLQEASRSVEILKEELNIMERHLREANQKAEEVLLEVTQRAKEAEKIKESVSKVKDRAEKIVAQIDRERVVAEAKLEAAKPALQVRARADDGAVCSPIRVVSTGAFCVRCSVRNAQKRRWLRYSIRDCACITSTALKHPFPRPLLCKFFCQTCKCAQSHTRSRPLRRHRG